MLNLIDILRTFYILCGIKLTILQKNPEIKLTILQKKKFIVFFIDNINDDFQLKILKF